MFENKRKITISTSFLVSLCFICLLVSVFMVNTDFAVAYDSNESTDEMESNLDIEDKLENSQGDDVLQDSRDSKSSKTFDDIREMVESSQSGGTINLEGTYVASKKNDVININKKVSISSVNGAVLDGKNISSIFSFKSGAESSTISNIKFVNANGDYGGAINIRSNDVKITNCEFEDNSVDRRGAAVYIYAKGTEFYSCSFNRNRAGEIGGAIYAEYDGLPNAALLVKDSNFTYNSATTSAGAVSALSNNSLFIDCIFDNNFVINDKISFGGAIQIGLDTHNSHGNVYNCIFSNNYAISTNAESHGGAGCVRNGSSYYNCVFINNSADYGAGLTYHANGTIENCTFINNSANKYGGAIAIKLLHNNMNLNITDCVFKENKAPYGGAIKLSGMNIKIENSTFDDNYASVDGAAINIEAGNVDVFNSKFNRNTAENDGGAIFIISKNTQIKDCEFISNSAIPDKDKLNDGLAGAIYINSTQALVENNVFKFNTARNGSAIYYDKFGNNLTLINNTLFENQAWVYWLPIYAEDIYYGEVEEIKSIIYGGNNIAKYDNLAISNAIYNGADAHNIEIDGENPVLGATMSGELYQDSREYNIKVLLTVVHEDGTVVYNNSLYSNYLGEIFTSLDNLKPGRYYVTANHFNDTYYKPIVNQTSFRVIPKVDVSVKKSADKTIFDYEDIVVWTLNVTNNGPNNATGVYLMDILPEGLVLLDDVENYDSKTGKLDIGDLNVGENRIINLRTIIYKTGEISNKVNITSEETDIDLSNNFDEKMIYVNPASDLEVKKSVNKSNPNYRESVQWTITVVNKGPDIAYDVFVYDIIPNGLKLIDSTGDYDEEKGLWNIGDLDVNQKVVLNIFTLVNSTGLIENNVSVKSSNYDYDLSNNNDSEIITVDLSCDLAITKSVNVTSANYGDLIKWRLDIVNNGPSNATGVKIKELLPDAFILISNSLNINLTDGYFDIGDLKVGEKLTLDLICKVNRTGNFTNVVEISGEQFDFDLSNNEDSEPIEINRAADLGVIKLVSEFEPRYKDKVIWTIHVYNNGPDIAHEVVVRDLFVSSLIWVDDDSKGSYNHYSGEWNVGNLTVGEIRTLKITSIVNATGLIENEVSVWGHEFDYNLTNNQDMEVIAVNESADLSIVKSVNSSIVNYGDLVKWTLTVSNNGPSNATAVNVCDILPEGLILINYTASKGMYDEGKWVMCCLAVGETQILDIVCRVNKTGNITNVATVFGDEYDPDGSNNEDNESIAVPKAVDIEVKIDVNNTSPFFGEHVKWTVILKNNGPDNATEVNVTDELPSELIFVGYNATKGDYNDNVWNVGPLAIGETQYLEILCIVNDLNPISDAVSAKSKEYDWNYSNNYDDETINPIPVCDLSIIKSVDVSNANYGDLIRWNLAVLNKGPNDATGVMVEDILPSGLRLIESDGDYDGHYWNVGNLDAGETKVLEIVCKVEATGEFVNYANVYGNEHDPDLSNNDDDESININPASDLAITKKVSKYNYFVGESIEYVIEVINNGPDKATNIKITEFFDDFLIIKSFKASLGEFDDLNLIWTIDSLDVGQKAVLNIRAIATAEGIVRNSVHVTSDNFDYDLSNNNDSVIINVTEKPSNNQNLTKKVKTNNQDAIKSNNYKSDGIARINLQKHSTANPILILMIVSLFSIIFSCCNISKKR